MSNSAKAEAVLALHRFGMGPRPGSIAAVGTDPRGALIAELDRPLVLSAATNLPTSAKAFRTVADANARRTARAKQAQQQAKKQQMASAPAMSEDQTQAPGQGSEKDAAEMAAKQAAEAVPDPGRPMYLQEAKLRTEAALAAEIGFAERLVWFWSNHFCISANKIQSMSGAYEREAIRANTLGRFVDLLLAVEGHPAMLFYLDNLESMGANSIAGINRNRGLNENIAREIMELHTLGVRTGYTQDDVISFANVMTGWTLVPPGVDPQHGGEFTFNPRLHEPGGQTVLGKRYEQEDAEQGRAVLRDLAANPATATHVATKLARHFVADEPPPALIEPMAKTFRDTEGDLKQVAITMVSSDEAWRGPPSKLKRPSEWVIGMVRATGITVVDPVRYTGGQELLGEALWRPSAPKGYPDDEASWIDGVGRRLDVANNFAERITGTADPQAIIEDVFASEIGADVKQAVGRAESRQQALALLFMSADFQRR
ncbi:DUF1800 domain-containing protein [Bradyrhizobium commune]|uniref:DUF1800 domain-containing protein n=1 Tax=Bradyrhizobium commune TaxID=83627 RepID=A0A7S9DAQ3_9BRAD|nr:DUF1800 domain-containing protein [Bradyrhizobium commune]QPF93514.1 DUF1800 domain-containing protein [Bradyrhizobium commune]